MKTVLKLFVVLVLGVAAWLAWGLWLPVRPAGEKFVLLHPGYSTRHIAAELNKAGVIRSPRAFLLWHYIAKPRSLKAGEYLFEKSASAIQVHERLARGDIYQHTVTIPEGFNMFDVAAAVEAAGLGPRAEFLAAAKSGSSMIKDLDPEATSLEGYLFPDTYQFTRTQGMQDIIGVMVRHFRQEAKALGLTGDVHLVVTMASIVEKETAAPAERPEVASVYYNRLEKRIALDADPSVIYAALLSGEYEGALHHATLQIDSPYNTYKHAGLPPGPIANPGRDSLKAAMHPAQTDYLYFVSDNQGHHRFARSLDEHNRNVAAYRRAVSASR
jgi:peptidoglycan lytic transglycosylase G